jgi:hypothetical protein
MASEAGWEWKAGTACRARLAGRAVQVRQAAK